MTFVFVNWNTRDLLRRALDAMQDSSAGLSCECVVVDNGSTDGSVELVRDGYPDVKLIALETNRGPTVGYNLGIASAKGDKVMLLNTDAFLTGCSVRAMLAYLDTHPGYGAVAPRLLNEDGSTQRALMRFPTRTSLIWHDSVLSRLWPHNRWRRRYFMEDFDYESDRDIDQPPLAVFLVRSEVARQLGSLDEELPMYFSDVDWCVRMRRAGWRIGFLAQATVVHIGGASTRRLGDISVQLFRDRIRFARKWFGRSGAALCKFSTCSFALAEALACLRDREAPWPRRRSEARRVLSMAWNLVARS